jgi:hypothetical protein
MVVSFSWSSNFLMFLVISLSWANYITQNLGRHLYFMFGLLYCDQPCPVRKTRGLEHRRPELGLHCLCPEAGEGGRVQTR